MSSNIPTRRVTRATQRLDENTLKGRSLTTRTGNSKSGNALSSAVVPLASGPSKANSTLDVNTQHKRKREALGEVTNNNKNKAVIPRGVTDDGTIIKPQVVIQTKTTRTTAKVPVRKTRNGSVHSITSVTEKKAKANQHTEDAMAVDEAAPTLYRVTRRVASSVLENSSKTLITAPQIIEEPFEEKDDNEPEVQERAFKKRRTSSDIEATVEPAEDPLADDEALPTVTLDEAQSHSQPENAAEEDSEEEVTCWDDLDAEDHDDPYMVSEYVVDIFKYLSQCEEQTLPSSNYMYHQKELCWKHRGVLMDYLIGIHFRFKLTPETLYLMTNIIDRFLSVRVVSLSKLHLVGMASLFIASKFEDIMSPSVSNLALISNGEVKEDELLKAERYILKTLNWGVSLFPQPMNWLRRVSKADGYNQDVRAVAKYFLEIHVVERKLVGVKPSLLAAASIWLGRLILGVFGWTPNLAHYSGYSEKKIIPIANIMLSYCLRPEKHENFVRKYSTKKYSKVAVYVHDWITSRWTLGEKVSLQDELPYLIALGTERQEE
ncbi:hypothetical protein Clacol_004746 [Clathrus columnatus]|uniref:Cyclin N-terminal domain-containing protein n=1 Tax=Clathrus columnatus TaxID=1419009 RepID=A0AAV5AC76_9AGAM|nr:hypothetical protein Clacol_004746 [Clathrus columnatus]